MRQTTNIGCTLALYVSLSMGCGCGAKEAPPESAAPAAARATGAAPVAKTEPDESALKAEPAPTINAAIMPDAGTADTPPAPTPGTQQPTASRAKGSKPDVAAATRPRVIVTLEKAERVGGGGSASEVEVIRQDITRRMSALRVCYEARLRKQPTLQGTVVKDLTFELPDAVPSVRPALGSVNAVELGSCVHNILQAVRITPDPQAGSVTYRVAVSFATPNGEPWVGLPE